MEALKKAMLMAVLDSDGDLSIMGTSKVIQIVSELLREEFLKATSDDDSEYQEIRERMDKARAKSSGQS